MLREHTHDKPHTQASRVAFFDDFPEVTPQPGTILVRTRAISARVNKNYDGFPSDELRKAYKSFIGRPVFVNHNNLNYRQTRGIVRGSVYKENGMDKHVDLLIEVDARAYPRLAAEIEAGRLDGVSMGCLMAGTTVSMADGDMKPIEKIEVDDEIITHRGNKEIVTYVTEREYDGPLVSLKAYGLAWPIAITPEHPVWVRAESPYADSGWVEAADIKAGDWVLTPSAVCDEKLYVEGAAFPDKEGLWRRVKYADVFETSTMVYNLDVDGDDSYVAGKIAVHNCDVGFTVCSYCNNVARDPYEFCDHVLFFKGTTLPRVNSNFEKEAVFVYEQCKDVNFFEISFVFDPADETALIQEVYVPGGFHHASYHGDAVIPKLGFGETIAPPEVDTLRDDKECPLCGNQNYDGAECTLCQYVAPPDELKEPDLEKAKQVDLRQDPTQRQAPLDRHARRNLSTNPFVRRS